MSVDDVKAFYAAQYPELATAVVNGPEAAGDKMRYTFDRAEPHDAIEGCFDEDAQGMYEVIPEPNLILRLNGEDEQSVREAFRVLAVLCETLVCASRLMKMMPGNEPLQRIHGDDA
jgi:hypothetical protein